MPQHTRANTAIFAASIRELRRGDSTGKENPISGWVGKWCRRGGRCKPDLWLGHLPWTPSPRRLPQFLVTGQSVSCPPSGLTMIDRKQ